MNENDKRVRSPSSSPETAKVAKYSNTQTALLYASEDVMIINTDDPLTPEVITGDINHSQIEVDLNTSNDSIKDSGKDSGEEDPLAGSQYIYVKVDMITKLFQEITCIQNSNKEILKELKELKSEKNQMSTIINQLTESKENLFKELKDLKDLNSEAQQKSDNIMKELIELKNDKAQMSCQIEELVKSVKDLPTTKSTLPSTSNNSANNNKGQREKTKNNNSNKNKPESNTIDVLKENIGVWGKQFHARRKEFRRCHRNIEKAAIIEEFLDRDEVFITAKHRPKYAYNEEEYNLRVKLNITAMKNEIELLKMHGNTAKKNYEKIDIEMMQKINNVKNSREKELLTVQWEEEVKKSEIKGKELNENSLNFYRNLPNHDPYLGYPELKKYLDNKAKERSDQHYHYNNQNFHWGSGQNRAHWKQR